MWPVFIDLRGVHMNIESLQSGKQNRPCVTDRGGAVTHDKVRTHEYCHALQPGVKAGEVAREGGGGGVLQELL